MQAHRGATFGPIDQTLQILVKCSLQKRTLDTVNQGQVNSTITLDSFYKTTA